MPYPIFSNNAPTGESAKTTVSTNTYSPKGRTIGYPTNFDVYVQHIADEDGSQSVVEQREVADIIGNKLYLFHRPLIDSNGTVTTITPSQGSIDASSTNAAQAYIVFDTLPTSSFTVSYVAVPDCDLTWGINNLQNSIMEVEKSLGPKGDTTYPGMLNLQLGLFDNPTGVNLPGGSKALTQGVYLSHLDRNIQISSSDDASLQLLYGSGHDIQIGNGFDTIIVDTDTFTITNSVSQDATISLGARTGDNIYWKGTASGAGPLVVGGPEWPDLYAGVTFANDLSGEYYSGSLLRVHGDASFIGDVRAIGNITIVNTTGETSVVLGDWTVKDELFVEGVSHLIGRTETNRLDVQGNLHIDRDIIADNQDGSGGLGQSLVDGLDCSEVAHTYDSVIRARHANSVVAAPKDVSYILPTEGNISITKPGLVLSGDSLLGEELVITGSLNAAPSNSGAHPCILQLLIDEEVVYGTYPGNSTFGTTSGLWSPGLMEPGMLRIKMTNGSATGLDAPIYAYTVEETGTANNITRLNVFIPESFTPVPAGGDTFSLYNPGAVTNYSAVFSAGTNPFVDPTAFPGDPLVVSAETTVRKATLPGASIDITNAILDSTSGQAAGSKTGTVYLFADCNGSDPELPPVFKARATPWPMNGQVPVAEATYTGDASFWYLAQQTCYRPNGYYDSAWIPILTGATTDSEATYGRVTPRLLEGDGRGTIYFKHNLGTSIDLGNLNANLYLSTLPSESTYNQTHSNLYSAFTSSKMQRISLGPTETLSDGTATGLALVNYLDSTLIGINISETSFTGFADTGTPKYLRLTLNKNN